MGTHVRTLRYFRSFSLENFAKRKNIVTFVLERQKEVLSVADAHKGLSASRWCDLNGKKITT